MYAIRSYYGRLCLLLGPLAYADVHETLARVEGTLGVEAPSLLVFSRTATGWDAEYHYAL